MAKFKNLNDLEKYLQKNMMQILSRNGSIERILADAMAMKAWEVVYDAYDPVSYNRREDEGGLADNRNYAITDFGVRDGKVYLTFENLTQGNDNLKDLYLIDTIEEGIKANWNNPNGAWSEKRPMMAETARHFNENPTELLEALKGALISRGFTVR